MMSIMNTEKCTFEGCNNLAEKYKVVNGKTYFRKWCTRHKRIYYGMTLGGRKCLSKNGQWISRPNAKERFKAKKLPCSICNWDKAPCDVHRKISGKENGTYSMKNMVSLCPNCHRLVHLGIIQL